MSMLERLPANARTPAVARAITAPSSVLLAGAAMSAAILGGVPIAVAAVAGGVAWAARVAMAARPRRPGPKIDPFAIGDPWRRMVIDAQQAQARFQRAVDRSRPGPLRDRLAEMGSRLDHAVQECWRIACQGDNLEGALTQLEIGDVERDLAEAKGERRATGASPALDRTIKALEAQLASAERITNVAIDARDRLRLLNAQMDESVARAIELSVSSGDVSALNPLADDVDSLVGDLEALRQALEETGRVSTA
ncbi:MAG TPA: hypothetical protein VM030_10420 [Acidimicrobiales bacterium]|nr:hypothetical protein [Acidimicrobiales bacterium]